MVTVAMEEPTVAGRTKPGALQSFFNQGLSRIHDIKLYTMCLYKLNA